jgi:hypothetical protein
MIPFKAIAVKTSRTQGREREEGGKRKGRASGKELFRPSFPLFLPSAFPSVFSLSSLIPIAVPASCL